MSDSFKLATVTDAIAAMGASISLTNAAGGSVALTIQDIDEMTTDAIGQEQCPIMRPMADKFLSLENGAFFARDSYGADGGLASFRYTLTYDFFFCPVAQGNTILGMYAPSVTALVATILYFDKHTNSITGATEVIPVLKSLAPVTNNGILFHGGQIAFNVMQYVEA